MDYTRDNIEKICAVIESQGFNNNSDYSRNLVPYSYQPREITFVGFHTEIHLHYNAPDDYSASDMERDLKAGTKKAQDLEMQTNFNHGIPYGSRWPNHARPQHIVLEDLRTSYQLLRTEEKPYLATHDTHRIGVLLKLLGIPFVNLNKGGPVLSKQEYLQCPLHNKEGVCSRGTARDTFFRLIEYFGIDKVDVSHTLKGDTVDGRILMSMINKHDVKHYIKVLE